MRKKPVAILMITAIYICIAGASLVLLSDAKYRIRGSTKSVDVEYMSIRYSGGYTGHIDDYVRVYCEDDKYYIESSDDEDGKRHQLTRTEYLQCTDIDFDGLRDMEGVQGSDLIYETIEYRMKGGETVTLPKKSYWYIPGMIIFYGNIKSAPAGEVTRADEIAAELGNYFYLNGSPDARFVSSQNISGSYRHYVEIYYGTGDAHDRYEFSQDCRDGIDNKAGMIVSTGINHPLPDEKFNEMMKDYKKVRSGSQTLYYQVQSNDKITLITVVDYANRIYYCTYFDKAHASESEVKAIMLGTGVSHTGLYIALAVETLLAAAAVAIVLVRPKKTNASQNEVESSEV